MKKCKKCNNILEENKFRKGRNSCKDCEKILLKIWRKNNKEHIKEYNKNYFQQHKKEIVNSKKEYLYNYRQTDKYKKHKKEYAKLNREKINLQIKERLKNDLNFKLKHQIRVLINKSLKENKKNEKTEKILGCDLNEFSKYLLETYKKNYGYEYNGKEKVHIDHIIPLSCADSKDKIIKLCHYTNLQLLKAHDNLKKSNKIIISNQIDKEWNND